MISSYPISHISSWSYFIIAYYHILLSYVIICHHISSRVIIYNNVFPTKSPTHIYMYIFRPCDYFSLVSHNLQELVDAVWDEDRWGSNGIGAWVGDVYWIMCYHVFCFLFMFLIFFSVFFNDFYVCTMLFLFVNCIMLHWFRWKEFDESSGHGHSAVHVIHSATPRTRRLRGEIWFSKTFVRCDAGNWAFKASFSSQRGVV